MRLWSLHPKYLDPQGLVALWREALLAQAVLLGRTRGYTRHPQRERVRAHDEPDAAIGAYLAVVHGEATRRGYAFDATKIGPRRDAPAMGVGSGQLAHEWRHLQHKLAARSPAWAAQWDTVATPDTHPLFFVQPGPVASWERAPPTSA